MWGTGVASILLLLSTHLIVLSHQRPANVRFPEALYYAKDASGSAVENPRPEGSGRASSAHVRDAGSHPSRSSGTSSDAAPAFPPVPTSGDGKIVFPTAVPETVLKPMYSEGVDTRYLIKVKDIDCPPNHKEAHGKDCREAE